MKTKRLYVKPTMQVVEMITGSPLLDTSTTTTTLRGYEYQENTTNDGWTD